MDKQEFYKNKMSDLSGKLDEVIDKSLKSKKAMKKLTDHYRIEGLYNYSFINSMMIQMQGGKIAQSYKKWIEFGRNVKKGEKAFIYIFRPNSFMSYKCNICKHKENKKEDLRKHFVKVHKQKDKKIQDAYTSKSSYFNYENGFSLSPVFNADQTEGKPIEYKHNSKELIDLDYDFIVHRIKTVYNLDAVEEITGRRRGFVSLANDKILHVSSMSNKTDKIKTLIHELAHVKLGHTKDTYKLSRRTGEVEAEAVTLLIMSFLGADIELSQAYINNWKDDTAQKQVRRKKIISVTENIIKKCLEIKTGKEILKEVA